MLALDPGNALAYENLGTAQLQAKDYKAAETSLRRAVQLDPSLAGAYTALGVVLATSRKAEAIDGVESAPSIPRSGHDVNALFNLDAQPLCSPGGKTKARDIRRAVHPRGADGDEGRCRDDKEGVGTLDRRRWLGVRQPGGWQLAVGCC